jgi:hypothetical protein
VNISEGNIIFNLEKRIVKGYEMGSALFWDFTQRRMVVSYRRFGTTYWSHLQGSNSQALPFISFIPRRKPEVG